MPKKRLFLVLPYLGKLLLQTRTWLRKSLKVFKNQKKLANAFLFKGYMLQEVASGVAYKFQYGLCNECYHGQCVINLNVRNWEAYVNLTIG